MENNNQSFEYTYSAKQQAEIEKIRKKYLPKAEEENKMETLRRLDKGVVQKGTAASIIVGVIGALIMGVGMCCTMVWADKWFVPGVAIGIIGIAVLSAAYPLYQHIIKKERQKIAPEIIRLTEELMK